MKTYHNDANTRGITKISLKELQKSDFQVHFSTSKIVQIFTKKKFIEEYQFRTTTFAIIIF